MRRPDENDYDPSTVYIPKEEFKKLDLLISFMLI